MMEIDLDDRTRNVFACSCNEDSFTIVTRSNYARFIENFCPWCGTVWTRVAHIPRSKIYVKVRA